jgi:adenylate cyclase
MSHPSAMAPGGKLQEVTILMSDLRGFTSLTSQLGPNLTLRVLNAYLAEMTRVIHEHGGMVDEFVGDAIMALFGAPEVRPDDTQRAVRCAIAMQRALRDLNQGDSFGLEQPLQMGIAVHCGEVVLGNIGSEQRLKYGVVGDAVNVAGRIEALTIGKQVLISAAAYDGVRDRLEVGEPRQFEVKGGSKPLTVYEVHAMNELFDALSMPTPHEAPMRKVQRAGELFRFENKAVVDAAVPVEITRIGRDGAVLVSAIALALRGDIKLRVERDDGTWEEELYGKVISELGEHLADESVRYRVAFTGRTRPADD